MGELFSMKERCSYLINKSRKSFFLNKCIRHLPQPGLQYYHTLLVLPFQAWLNQNELFKPRVSTHCCRCVYGMHHTHLFRFVAPSVTLHCLRNASPFVMPQTACGTCEGGRGRAPLPVGRVVAACWRNSFGFPECFHSHIDQSNQTWVRSVGWLCPLVP